MNNLLSKQLISSFLLCILELLHFGKSTPLRNSLTPSSSLGNGIELGTCYDEMKSADVCTRAIEIGVSKQDCCRHGVLGRGWSPHLNVTASQLFYWSLMYNGIPDCQPCHDTCEGVQCGDNRRCRMRNGSPRCVCAPDCSSHDAQQQGPVCASDGRTYRNLCSLLRYNCKKRRSETVAYYGRCQYSCDNVDCLNGRYCVVDQNALPHCISCQMDCPVTNDPSSLICGGDGQTYPSMCHLMRTTCLQGHSIGIAYRGPCIDSASCNTVSCQPGQNCLTDPVNQRPRCITCSSWCSPYYGNHLLCGTDDNTYEGWCDMHNTACSTGTVIETKHYGACGTNPVSEIYTHHHRENSSED